MNTDLEKLNYLRNEIEHRGIFRVKPGSPTLPGKAPNSAYTWQFYLRRCMFDPKFVTTAAELLVNQLPNQAVQIGACEAAGVPLGLAMSIILGTPMLSIKKSPKSYGLLNCTEGRVTGQPVVLVDDLAGSQITLRTADSRLARVGLATADFYVALVNKTYHTHDSYLENKKLISLFTCDDFAMSWSSYEKKYSKEPDFGKIYQILKLLPHPQVLAA